MKPFRAAAFQFEAVHEDLAGSFFRSASDLNVSCTGYFNKRIVDLRGDFFSVVGHPQVTVNYERFEERADWDNVAHLVRLEQPDLLYFNTLQRDGIAQWAEQFGLPIVGVVHNPYLFKESGPCIELAKSGRLDVIGLAPHVVNKIIELVPHLEGRAHTLYPYEWMADTADEYTENPDVLDVMVPGAVDFKNRDYEGLISYLASGVARSQRPFRLVIPAGGADRARLQQEVLEQGLEQFFEFLPLDPQTGRVPHKIFLTKLYQCHAVLPLLPVNRQDYLTSKITTGIAAALGTGRPIIAPRNVADAYGFSPIELPKEQPWAIAEADLSATKLELCRRDALAVRAAALHHNSKVVEKIVGRFSGQKLSRIVNRIRSHFGSAGRKLFKQNKGLGT